MAGKGMILRDGVYYTPEDAAALDRMKEAREAREVSGKPVTGERVAELESQVANLQELVETLVETFGERIGAVEAAAGVTVSAEAEDTTPVVPEVPAVKEGEPAPAAARTRAKKGASE